MTRQKSSLDGLDYPVNLTEWTRIDHGSSRVGCDPTRPEKPSQMTRPDPGGGEFCKMTDRITFFSTRPSTNIYIHILYLYIQIPTANSPILDFGEKIAPAKFQEHFFNVSLGQFCFKIHEILNKSKFSKCS